MKRLGIGVRVRKVRMAGDGSDRAPIGTEGVIIGFSGVPKKRWSVQYNGLIAGDYLPGADFFSAADYMLEPILSPGTDEWAREKVKKFTKPEPVSPALPTKERVLK